MARIRKASTNIDIIIGIGLDKERNIISADEFAEGKRIYEDVFKKVKMSELSELDVQPETESLIKKETEI